MKHQVVEENGTVREMTSDEVSKYLVAKLRDTEEKHRKIAELREKQRLADLLGEHLKTVEQEWRLEAKRRRRQAVRNAAMASVRLGCLLMLPPLVLWAVTYYAR